jgi:hypothetical protein
VMSCCGCGYQPSDSYAMELVISGATNLNASERGEKLNDCIR